jgi:hypothetical protein
VRPRACPHDQLKPCRSCIAKRNRTRGLSKQRIVFDILEIPVKFRGQRSNEELWGESPYFPDVKFEVKSGKMPALITNAIIQSQLAHKSIGSNATYAVALMPEGSQDPWVVMPLKPLVNILRETAEAGNSWRIRDLARAIKQKTDEIEGLTR